MEIASRGRGHESSRFAAKRTHHIAIQTQKGMSACVCHVDVHTLKLWRELFVELYINIKAAVI